MVNDLNSSNDVVGRITFREENGDWRELRKLIKELNKAVIRKKNVYDDCSKDIRRSM